MSRETYEILQEKLKVEQKKKKKSLGGLDGGDYTSGLHDDPSIVRDMQFTDAIIAQFTSLLAEAEPFDTVFDGETVQLGNLVTIRFVEDEEEETFRMGTAADAAHNTTGIKWVSTESPLGKLVISKKVGQTFTLTIENGQSVRIKILRIEKPHR
jgi:transcription elongation GreA/GreB family factor